MKNDLISITKIIGSRDKSNKIANLVYYIMFFFMVITVLILLLVFTDMFREMSVKQNTTHLIFLGISVIVTGFIRFLWEDIYSENNKAWSDRKMTLLKETVSDETRNKLLKYLEKREVILTDEIANKFLSSLMAEDFLSSQKKIVKHKQDIFQQQINALKD